MESKIVSLINELTPVNDLVDGRVYPQAVPETGTLPAITYAVISSDFGIEFDGQNEISQVRIQLQPWSEKYSTSKTITKELIKFFGGYSGVKDDVRFHSIFVSSAVDLYNSDLKEYGNNIDLIINYEEITA